MPYEIKKGAWNQAFNSKEEHEFYDKITKNKLFLVLQQFSILLKDDNQSWMDKVKEELSILKSNGIK